MLEVTSEVNGTEGLICVKGRMDTKSSPQLTEEINKIIDSLDKLILDIAEVEYVSSSGLRVFLAADKKMIAKGGEMNVKNVPKPVMDVFDMTGFSDALTII